MNAPLNTSSLPRPIKVMVVDDSAAIRAIIKRVLSTNSDIEICGAASNGQDAVNCVERLAPDVVVLDIEMPIMDGITCLPLLLEKKPDAKVLICSTLSDHGADVSIKALSMGAADCLLKPTGPDAIRESQEFSEKLIALTIALGKKNIRRQIPTEPRTPTPPPNLHISAGTPKPQILAIGTSTGGPNALLKILPGMKDLPEPIVITQHMPPKFTKLLAEQIQKASGIACSEAENGMVLENNHAYVAHGDYHMVFEKIGSKTVIRLDDGEPENFCRPAVDPMMRSLIPIYGPNIYACILTGMGNDGLQGCQKIVDAGGHVIAQDEDTSVVWGMPGAVAKAGICSHILPENKIADHINRVFSYLQ